MNEKLVEIKAAIIALESAIEAGLKDSVIATMEADLEMSMAAWLDER